MKKKLMLLIVIVALLFMVACNKNNQEIDEEQDQVNEVIDENEDDKNQDNEVEEDEQDDITSPEESDSENDEDNEQPNDENEDVITEEKVLHIIDQFQNRLFVEVDDDLKVKSFNTKEELAQFIAEYAEKNLVYEFVDQFYYEDEDGLYIIPQSSPPLLDVHEPITLEQLNDERYLVTQAHQSEAYGELTFNILIEIVNGRLIITNYGVN